LTFVTVDEDVAAEIRALLLGMGFDVHPDAGYDDSLRRALFEFVGTENLEARWTDDPAIEQGVLDTLRIASERSR
jgi:hypothetical protein